MSKVHTVYRMVKANIGGGFSTPVKTYEDQKDAEHALKTNAASLAEIIEGTVLVKTPQGPRAVMTVKQLLNELGIGGWSYSILSTDVHSGVVVTPTASIIQ